MLIAEWMEGARCASMDPAVFEVFGDRGAAKPEALAACLDCPVRAECLADPSAVHDEAMVRGGLTPFERRRARLGKAHIRARQRGHSLEPAMLLRLEEMHRDGYSSREISDKLDVSDRTVRYRIAQLAPNYQPPPSQTWAGRKKRPAKKVCSNAHEWTEENTVYDRKGRRQCRKCTTARFNSRKEKQNV